MGMPFKGLTQAYEMQDFAHGASMALRETMQNGAKLRAPSKDEAAMIGTLNKAWKDAQDQVRIHRGKPLPGSLSHAPTKVSSRKLRMLQASMLASAPAQPSAQPGPGPGDDARDAAPPPAAQ